MNFLIPFYYYANNENNVVYTEVMRIKGSSRIAAQSKEPVCSWVSENTADLLLQVVRE